ncbi:tubulin--tyrosine ligase-like protein 12 [Homarus americanus]|uniref:Tubulin--tyrosine ligase-like protein 12-like n=1 Tax=Homarus americanus TaxID=6706 RepID=A0A8J5KH47_HOMAM|nr:tubulin--tyrosine ligase-like protein 12 [Homarus americanus]KAG7169029.1 Tubulin--tyrosine ligase-like protein 12-like [Homarus americanus]
MDDYNGLEKTFVEQHKIQLESSGVPRYFWPTVLRKLQGQVYDAGESFQLCQLTYADGENDQGEPLWQVIVTKPDGIKATDPENIFLIDHAWTYRAHEARQYLRDIPGLLERMVALMVIPRENNNREQFIEKVLQEMWKFNGTYSLGGKTPEERLPVWFIMDEFGSRIQHCGEPNFRVIPFYYAPHQCCYSLLFPIEDVEEGDEVTRNFVETPPVDTITRDAQMLPWFPEELSHVDPQQTEPLPEFFQCGRMNETLPDCNTEAADLPTDRPLHVYAEYECVREYLTDTRFVVVDFKEEADILWMVEHFKDFRSLRDKPHCRVNQYLCEHLITVKDLLAVVCRRSVDSRIGKEEDDATGPSWLPLTYCLKRELVKFVSLFQRKEKRGKDNHWIIKPWNLARGLDHTITNNLNHIIRLPSTGPKIAQKYISNPVLFHREDIDADVKFDIRYIVMLLSVEPLKVAVYKRFWIRFANQAFDLTELDNNQKHFTVNNYNDAFLLQMYCHDFICKFNSQFPEQPWQTSEEQIYNMIHQVFKCATAKDHPQGIPHNPQCKGFYGFDVMLEWTSKEGKEVMQPQLLEVNFNSDCKRACEYYPEFFNDIFSVMFLDEVEGHNVAILQ